MGFHKDTAFQKLDLDRSQFSTTQATGFQRLNLERTGKKVIIGSNLMNLPAVDVKGQSRTAMGNYKMKHYSSVTKTRDITPRGGDFPL